MALLPKRRGIAEVLTGMKGDILERSCLFFSLRKESHMINSGVIDQTRVSIREKSKTARSLSLTYTRIDLTYRAIL